MRRTGKAVKKFTHWSNGRTSKASEAKTRTSARISAESSTPHVRCSARSSKSSRLREEKKSKFWDMSCLILLLKDHNLKIPNRETDLVRPKVHQQFSSCDMSVIIWLPMVAIWKPKTLRYRSAVSPLIPQVAQSPWLTGMPEVGRLKTNTLQAFLLRLRAGKSLKVWKGLFERFPNCNLAATTFAVILSPTRYARELENLSQGLQWMLVGENQPVSAAAGTGRMGTDGTTLTEVVEPTCSVAARYRLPVHVKQFLQYCTSWWFPDSHTEF